MSELNKNELLETKCNGDCANCDCEHDSLEGLDLEDIVSQLIPQVQIDIDEVDLTPIDKEEFEKGVKEVSKLCGMYSTLRSVGIDNSSSVDIIMNLLNIEYNKETNKQTCDNNLKVAKLGATTLP